jgi:hypothetical protein
MSVLRPAVPRILRRSAPLGYRLDDYKRWFPKTGEIFLDNLRRNDAFGAPFAPGGAPLGVVVMPWVSTPVPWYSVMLALGLARRGRTVVLVWDDTGFPELHLDEQNRVIGDVLEYVGRFMPVVRVGDTSPQRTRPSDADVVGAFTDQNVTWVLRGAARSAADEQLAERIRTSLRRSLPLIRATLERLRLDCLVLPGGVYGTSGLFRHEGEAGGCRVATFDTDRRIGQLAVSGIAAQSTDVPRAFDWLWRSGADARREPIAVARAELERRTGASDAYGFQALPARGTAVADAVVIPLNVEWDTAALGRHLHFPSTVDWVLTAIGEVLERGTQSVVVRQHPSERRKLQRSRLEIDRVLHDRFGDDPRVQFVAADDPVNSYDLLRSARLVLPYVSTIAIEAAAMGKPVLISGAAHFAESGFVWTARSRDEYLALLRRGIRGELPPLPEQRERAWTYYYLAAVANRIPTQFTPHPDDYWDWCRRPPEAVFSDPEVAAILEAIDRDVPISLVRHRRLLGVGTPP